MYNLKAKLTQVIIGATGTISKSLRQYLSNTPGKHEIIEIKKKGHIGPCIHTTESANVKVQNIFHGQNNITCSTTCKKQNSCNTIYPRNIVCFRYIIVNTLHKGYKKDDDDDGNNNAWTTATQLRRNVGGY